MSERAGVRSWAAACLAVGLAGCAATPPPPPDVGTPRCDLICQLLRLLEPAPPTPVAAIAPDPVPATAPVPTPVRPAKPARRRLASVRPTLPPETPQDTTVVPQAAPAMQAAGPAVPTVSPLLQTMSGSPAIAPPYFEPWTAP